MTTLTELEQALEDYRRTLEAFGIPCERVELLKVPGGTFRLDQHPPIGPADIGAAKRDAMARIIERILIIADVAQLLLMDD